MTQGDYLRDLAQRLTRGDSGNLGGDIRLRRGVVSAVDLPTSTATVTIGETSIAGVPFYRYSMPVVNDAVDVLFDGATPRIVGTIAPPLAADWVAPSLLNSWGNLGGGVNAAGYRRDGTGRVHLRGVVNGGTMSAAVFTLPAGYRPAKEEIFEIASNNAAGEVRVSAAGNVTPMQGSNVWVSLDGVSFDAYQ